MDKNSSKRPSQRTPLSRRKPSHPDPATKSGRYRFPKTKPDAHEGGRETEVGDRTGPGAGYDDEPEQVKDKGGVS